MVVLIAPTSLGYAAFLCKMSNDRLKRTSDADFIEIVNKNFSVDNATGHEKILRLFMTECGDLYNDFMTKLPVIQHLWTPP